MGGEVLVGSACREPRRADLVVQRVVLDVDAVRGARMSWTLRLSSSPSLRAEGRPEGRPASTSTSLSALSPPKGPPSAAGGLPLPAVRSLGKGRSPGRLAAAYLWRSREPGTTSRAAQQERPREYAAPRGLGPLASRRRSAGASRVLVLYPETTSREGNDPNRIRHARRVVTHMYHAAPRQPSVSPRQLGRRGIR